MGGAGVTYVNIICDLWYSVFQLFAKTIFFKNNSSLYSRYNSFIYIFNQFHYRIIFNFNVNNFIYYIIFHYHRYYKHNFIFVISTQLAIHNGLLKSSISNCQPYRLKNTDLQKCHEMYTNIYSVLECGYLPSGQSM